MSYRSLLNVSNGGPSNPKLTLKINSLRIKRKAQNFASWMLSEYAFKIGRKKGNDFFIIVPLLKEGLQPEGAQYYSETVINWICQFWNWEKTTKFWCSCKIRNTVGFFLLFSWNFIGFVKLTLKSDWFFCFTVPFSLALNKMRFRTKKWCDS